MTRIPVAGLVLVAGKGGLLPRRLVFRSCLGIYR